MSGRGDDWYRHDARAFLEGVQGMGPELIGAYIVLLDLIYARNGNLPRDDRHLAGVMGCSIRKARALTDQLIEAMKLSETEGHITNKRAETELERRRNERETSAKGGRTKAENAAAGKENKDLASTNRREENRREEKKEDPPLPPAAGKAPKALAARGDFDAFWGVCPRKVGKGAAAKAYAKALKVADHAALISAMSRYAAERDGRDPQFTVHPATWLNQERWRDEPEPPREDFHDQVAQALRGPDGLPDPNQDDHRSAQRFPPSLQAPGTHGDRHEPRGASGDGRSGQQTHLNLIRPRRFGGSSG